MADDIRRETSDIAGSAGGVGPQGLPGPYGAAGGALTGSYPNPDVAGGYLTDQHVSAAAAIAESKIAAASDAAPTQPSRRSSPFRSPVSWWKGDAFGGTLSAVQISNGNIFYNPIWASEPESWDLIALGVTIAGSTGAVIRACIVNDDGFGRPSTLIADLGTQTATSVAVKQWSIPSNKQTRAAGLYHLGFKLEGAPTTSPTVRDISSLYPSFGTDAPATISSGFYALSTVGAFSDPMPSIFPGGGFRPLGMVHVLSRP